MARATVVVGHSAAGSPRTSRQTRRGDTRSGSHGLALDVQVPAAAVGVDDPADADANDSAE